LKNSLKQIDFEPPKLETKHLIFSPKIEYLFSPPQTPKVVPCTVNSKPSKRPHSHENPREYPKHLLPLLTYAFVIENILPNLLSDPSMMWHLCRINHVWHKDVGESLKWDALNIVKYHNVLYRHIIVTQGLPRHFLKQHLEFEVHY
jgi:hypothetical protein